MRECCPPVGVAPRTFSQKTLRAGADAESRICLQILSLTYESGDLHLRRIDREGALEKPLLHSSPSFWVRDYMTEIQGSADWPKDFCGTVRLFPLPNLVLFPNVLQPLHIFEPRYCEMLADAMSSDRLIAMALLEKGWEHKYLQRPAIASTVCVGKVISHTPTEDGRHNILLVGMKRGQIIEELDSEDSFRKAKVKILEDYYPVEDTGGREDMTERLRSLFASFVPDAMPSDNEMLMHESPLGQLTDHITHILNLPLEVKQRLLEEQNVDFRCRLLIRCLEQQLERNGVAEASFANEFPPRFSQN